MGKLTDRIAIVAGGGQRDGEGTGNGRAASLAFAREGARVFVVDMFLERAQATVNLILQEGGKARAFAADVTKEDQCAAFVKQCLTEYGRIDIMFVNTGIVPNEDGGLLYTNEETWDKVFAVNLKGAWFCSRQALPVMIEQQSGVILFTSSLSAVAVGRGGHGRGNIAYPLSKQAAIRLAEIIAAQFAEDGIRCCSIMPGMIETPIGIEPSIERGMTREQVLERRNKMIPLKGGMGKAWDVANAAVFLASDDASFITGVTLPVDGGNSILRGF